MLIVGHEMCAEIPTDTAGISADALEDTLANWSTKYPSRRFPKLLYTMSARPCHLQVNSIHRMQIS